MIISISGYAKSGKDEFASMIQSASSLEFNKTHWAKRVKEVASTITGIPVEMFYKQSFKDAVLPEPWGMGGVYTGRMLLQDIGNGMRRSVSPLVWVMSVMEEVKSGNWLIPDTRFPQEADSVKAAGGVNVRITRPSVGPVNDDESETALDNYEFDYYIENDKDIKHLFSLAIQILESLDLPVGTLRHKEF